MNIRRSIKNTRDLNKYTTLQAAILSVNLGSSKGREAFKYFRIKDADEAQRVLRVMEFNAKLKASKEEQTKLNDDAINFYKDLTHLEQILGRSLDVEKIVVSQWIELTKVGEQIIKSKKQALKSK